MNEITSERIGLPVLFDPQFEVEYIPEWSCDWGYCDDPAVAQRWAYDFGQYLPVCARHLTGAPGRLPMIGD